VALPTIQAIGMWAAIGALALAFGPLIGGLISQHVHWGWIFLINVPVGVVTMALALFAVAESRDTSAARRLDVPGLAASVVALFSLTYGLIEGHDKGWASGPILGAFALAAVAGAGFVFIESRSGQPMVPLSMFRSRVFSGGIGTTMVWAFGIFGIYFFTSLYLQDVVGFSPTKAGLAFVPMALCVAGFSPISGPLAARFGTHRIVASGLVLNAIGLYLFWRLGQHTSFAALMPGFVLFGAGSGLMNAPLTNAALGAMPPERAGMASALLNNSRELAGLLGITVIGAVLRSRQGVALSHGVPAPSAYLDGYHAGLIVTIALIVAGVVISYLTLRRLPTPAPVATTESEPDLITTR
jgi:EmrB/QacA subfamily drug resistance transporter